VEKKSKLKLQDNAQCVCDISILLLCCNVVFKAGFRVEGMEKDRYLCSLSVNQRLISVLDIKVREISSPMKEFKSF
jgi:hypothetical protein